MIKEYLLKKIVDATLHRLDGILSGTSKGQVPTVDLESSLSLHLKQVAAWCKTISFADLHRPKATDQVFVELSLYVFPVRLRVDLDETVPTLPLKKAIEDTIRSAHVVLLGQPGAGKTTAMKHLCQQLLVDSEFLSGRINVPIVLRLRDLNERSRGRKSGAGLVFEAIQNILGLSILDTCDLQPGLVPATVIERVVVEALEELGSLVVLDGFDEVSTNKARDSVIADVRRLAFLLDKSTLIITSRSGDFTYSIDNCTVLELSPLSRDQVATLARRWLEDEEKASHFLQEVERSPFGDTQIRPLNLAHLLAIYDRGGRIPEKPKTVYRKVVQLLLEEWDEQRSVRRRSRYSGFELDRRFEFLCALAFILTLRQNRNIFSRGDLLRAYKDICRDFQLPEREGMTVLAEIEGHTGLLVRAGHDSFEFSHKSLQEYLTAEHIVRLPSIPWRKELLLRIPNELAIAISISSRPSQYFCELIFSRLLAIRLKHQFLNAFINRLLLERVDFERNVDASMAFVVLYSIYVHIILGDGVQLSLFVRQELIPAFEQIAGVLIKALPRSGLFEIYSLENYVSAWDGSRIAVFQKASHRPASIRGFYFSRFYRDLPRRLYVREDFIPPQKGKRLPKTAED